MKTDEKILRVLALIAAGGDRAKALDVLRWANKLDDVLIDVMLDQDEPKRRAKPQPKVSQSDVNEIYEAYPASDDRNGGRSTRKGEKDRNRIVALLSKGISKEHILRCIEEEKSGTAWLRNFETFLNNLPPMEDKSTDDIFKDY